MVEDEEVDQGLQSKSFGQASRTLKTFRQFDELFSSDAHTAFMTTPYWLLGRGSRMGIQRSAHSEGVKGAFFPSPLFTTNLQVIGVVRDLVEKGRRGPPIIPRECLQQPLIHLRATGTGVPGKECEHKTREQAVRWWKVWW